MKPSVELVDYMHGLEVEGSIAQWGAFQRLFVAEEQLFVRRFAFNSTWTLATVRLCARSSAPHGEYKRSKSLVRMIGCGVLLFALGWRRVLVCRTCVSEHQPVLLQSSDWPRGGLHGAQKWP